MMDAISTAHAIETRYAGCRFRSRLEARWAVFFDHLGIRWEYEPQGFDVDTLASRLRECADQEAWDARWDDPCFGGYLPDFWLPDLLTWFEVKGRYEWGADENARWEVFAAAVFFGLVPGAQAVMYVGSIPDPRLVSARGPDCTCPRQDWGCCRGLVFSDCDYAWCRCPFCNRYQLQYGARSERCPCGGVNGRPGDVPRGDEPSILAAYAAARSARFEHEDRERW